MYTLGFDERVWGQFFASHLNPPWRGWEPFGPERFPRPSSVAAISTKPSGTSLFITGFDGHVWSKLFDPDNLGPEGGWSKWFVIGGGKTFPTPGDVTAVSPKRSATELFIMDEEGRVFCAFFDPNLPGDPLLGHWQDWFQIGTLAFHPVEPVKCVRLHTKEISQSMLPLGFQAFPGGFSIATQINKMDQIFQQAGIRVAHMSNEFLNLPLLDDLDVGPCRSNSITAEQTELFNNINFVGTLDVVAYLVGGITSTLGALSGCGAHPPIRFGCVVARTSSEVVVAHEIGHVLDLGHCDTVVATDGTETPKIMGALPNRLMTGQGVRPFSTDLTPEERQKMRLHPRAVPGSTM
jgi:hypothetical protein